MSDTETKTTKQSIWFQLDFRYGSMWFKLFLKTPLAMVLIVSSVTKMAVKISLSRLIFFASSELGSFKGLSSGSIKLLKIIATKIKPSKILLASSQLSSSSILGLVGD
jgi:hypothetical protein